MLALAAIATLALVTGALVLFTGWMALRAQFVVPPLGDFLQLDGARIHFVDVGPDVNRGPDDSLTVVMIHGLGGTMRSFTYSLVDDLRKEFRVITLDRPGSGYSTRPDDRASITHQAQLVARFMAAKGLDRPLVVGHSFGGAVALALALDHPQSVGGLALLAPLTHPQKTIPEPFRGLKIKSPWLRWLIAWTVAVPVGICRRRASLEVIFGPDPVPRDFLTRGGGMLGMRPRSFYAMSTDLMASGSELRELSNRYRRLRLPVGILFGAADRILDSQFHGVAMSGQVAGLDLELIENGGHMTPITAPCRTANFVRRMAARVESAAAITP
jgi:pimeloyl-ACP methyl ester carboxylesterase